MKFPSGEHRQEQYAACGLMVAETARGIGIPIGHDLGLAWADMAGRLAAADDLSEQDPQAMTPVSLLERLHLDVNNPSLERSARDLLEANIRSHRAVTIDSHFEARGHEAHHTFGLLHHQSGDLATNYLDQWSQLYALTRLGTYLDCLRDAREDAQELDFSARQLALGALRHGAREMRQLRLGTLTAANIAAHEVGARAYILAKPFQMLLEPLLAPAK